MVFLLCRCCFQFSLVQNTLTRINFWETVPMCLLFLPRLADWLYQKKQYRTPVQTRSENVPFHPVPQFCFLINMIFFIFISIHNPSQEKQLCSNNYTSIGSCATSLIAKSFIVRKSHNWKSVLTFLPRGSDSWAPWQCSCSLFNPLLNISHQQGFSL